MKEILYNYDNLTLEEIDEKTTRARGLIVNSNEEILMCYSNGKNHYEFPGGHLEEGESLEEGLKREIEEETGITIETKNVFPFFSIKYFCKDYHHSGKNRLVEIYYYLINCDMKYDNLKRNLDDGEIQENYECRYIKISKLDEILRDNKKTTKETNSSLDDMLLVWEEFIKTYKADSYEKQ